MASSPSSNSTQQSSNSTSPPPPDSSSPPPPSDSSPPPPTDSSPPPPSPDNSKSPPPPPPSSQPPPPSKQKSPPPPSPSNGNSKSPPPPPPSPPPPQKNSHSHHSPPPPISHSHKKQSSSKSKSSSDSSSLSSLTSNKNLIAGVAAGAALLLFVMIALVCCCCCKKKKKRKRLEQMTYFGNNAAGNKTNQYYSSVQHSNWNNTNPYGDHAVKMPPPAYVSSSEWQAVPPPPPPPISSEMSSTGFSGSYPAPLPPPHPSLSLGFNNSTFTFEDLSAATGGFAKQNLLGQGGFGYVHKGVLPNGKEIAVKSLKVGSGQGDREFHAEVDIISRVHHRHLVSLVGYCIADSKRLLVYEFVPNNTLEYHLHGNGVPSLDFERRLKIALGSAKGFAYLHEDCHPRIIHRDIKAANILLDFNYEAKVADFGLAKLSNDNYTHVSTRIMGTFGYLAPEYASSGKLTEKSDVYSYGVVLLELITGRRPVDVNSDEDDNLVDWARPILNRATEGGSYEELVDPRLGNDYNPQEMLRMVASAAACIKHSARRRPKMSQIVRALEDDVPLEDLNAAGKHGHLGFESGGSDSYDSSTYNSQMRGFRKSSQDFTSSEHGTSTGEFAPRRSPFSIGDSQELRSN